MPATLQHLQLPRPCQGTRRSLQVGWAAAVCWSRHKAQRACMTLIHTHTQYAARYWAPKACLQHASHLWHQQRHLEHHALARWLLVPLLATDATAGLFLTARCLSVLAAAGHQALLACCYHAYPASCASTVHALTRYVLPLNPCVFTPPALLLPCCWLAGWLRYCSCLW